MFSNKSHGRSWQRASTATSHTSTVHRPQLLTNPKRKQMQLEESTRIYRDNMHLLAKLRDVDYKRKKRESSFHLSSLNIKNRLDTEERILTENLQFIERLQSQKSRYGGSHYRNPTVYNVSKYRTVARPFNASHSRTFTMPDHNVSVQQGSASKMVTTSDNYANRLLLYTELLTLRRQLYHFELSQCDCMYYVLLHELATDKTFKLRLVEQTGLHLVQLIKNNRINFSNQVVKRRGMFVLCVPFHPFVRHFTFWPLQKKTNRVNTAPIDQEEERYDEAANQDSEEVLRKEFEDSEQQEKWRLGSVDSDSQNGQPYNRDSTYERKDDTFQFESDQPSKDDQ